MIHQVNLPDQPKSTMAAMSTSGTAVYKWGSAYCDKCGKPVIYVGDVPEGPYKPWCECRDESGCSPWWSYNIDKLPVLREWLKVADDMDDPIELGWQCPLCKVVYAPHVDKCECGKG